MKKPILFTFFCFFLLVSNAQNEIYLIGSSTPIKVFRFKKVSSWVIKYYPEDEKDSLKYFYSDTVDYFIKKGRVYCYSILENIEKVDPVYITNETSLRGAIDACKNYTKYQEASIGTTISTFLFTFAGLGVAIGTSSTIPRMKNLNIPVGRFQCDSVYINAYKNQAKKIKAGKVWRGFGSGVLDAFLLVICIEIIRAVH